MCQVKNQPQPQPRQRAASPCPRIFLEISYDWRRASLCDLPSGGTDRRATALARASHNSQVSTLFYKKIIKNEKRQLRVRPIECEGQNLIIFSRTLLVCAAPRVLQNVFQFEQIFYPTPIKTMENWPIRRKIKELCFLPPSLPNLPVCVLPRVKTKN